MGSVSGSVGRAVASNTRGPRFESSHRQTFILKEKEVSIDEREKENHLRIWKIGADDLNIFLLGHPLPLFGLFSFFKLIILTTN